jgi:hypothetical protein
MIFRYLKKTTYLNSENIFKKNAKRSQKKENLIIISENKFIGYLGKLKD